MSDEADTFTKTLAGRVITFRQTHLGQVLMLQRKGLRAIRNAQELSATEERVNGLSQAMMDVLDFIDKQIIDPDDRQFVEDKMLEGKIRWEELMGVLGGGKQEQVADDEAPAKPTRKAPKKSPKAAPVAVPEVDPVRTPAKKSVASRGRTKR